MEESFRNRLIRIVTFLGGIYFFLEFVLPASVLRTVGVEQYHEEISYGFIVFGAMAIGLGIINLFLVHGSKIIFKRKDWFFSLVLLFGLIIMMTATTLDWLGGLEIANQAKKLEVLNQFSRVIPGDFAVDRADVPPLEVRTEALVRASQEAVAEYRELISRDALLTVSRAEELYPLGAGYVEDFSGALQRVAANSERVSAQALQNEYAPGNIQSYWILGESLSQAASLVRKIAQLNYDYSVTKRVYDLLYHGLFVALGSAMFSLLGVYIAAAAYRAFRIKSFESSLMMIAAVIVMLGQIPFYVYIYDGLPEIRQWLMEIPNSAAFRAIKIGAAIAGLVMAFRMWLSIESESFSQEKKN